MNDGRSRFNFNVDVVSLEGDSSVIQALCVFGFERSANDVILPVTKLARFACHILRCGIGILNAEVSGVAWTLRAPAV